MFFINFHRTFSKLDYALSHQETSINLKDTLNDTVSERKQSGQNFLSYIPRVRGNQTISTNYLENNEYTDHLSKIQSAEKAVTDTN